MKVDSMRKIDRWAGIPLTFLMSILLFLSRVAGHTRPAKPNLARVLFIELSEMGSAILVDPAMRKLRTEGGSELFFAIFRENYKSLLIFNTIEDAHIFKMRSDNLLHLALDVFRFGWWCRRMHIDTVIDLELFSRFTALLCAISGARSRIGFASHHDEGLYRGNIINFPVRYNAHVHISVNFVSLVNTALGKHTNPYTTTPVGTEELKLVRPEVDRLLANNVRKKISGLFPGYGNQRIVLINPNASDLLPQRRWMPDRFAMVAGSLLAAFDDILIIATGAPGEREYVQQVVDMVGQDRCVNSAGVFLFEELVPLYSLSEVMLTNDSGPAHFAAATHMKVFVLFGPETPALYLPLGNAEPIYLGLPCSPCVSAANHRKTTCTTRPCISGIETTMVLPKLVDYLRKNRTA